jgi:hypothetical protein
MLVQLRSYYSALLHDREVASQAKTSWSLLWVH